MSNFDLIMPTDENPSQIYSSVFDSFRKITSEISTLIDMKLKPLLGQEWQNNLALERQARVNLRDPEFIFKEPLRNSSSPVRLCFPREKSFYDLLDKAWKYRNQWFHNELIGTSKEALVVINTLYQIAILLDLNLMGSFCALEERLSKISKGAKYESEDQEIVIQKRIEEMEVQVLTLAKESNEAQMELIKAEQRESELEAEIQEIQKLLNDKDNKFQQSTNQLNAMNQTIIKLNKNLINAQNEREIAIQVAEDAKKYKREISEVISSMSSISSQKNINGDHIIPNQGNVWPYQRGSIRLTLSPRFRELYLPKTSTLLSEIIGKDAILVAAEWLKYRPSGGRVFMNDSGHATTYIGEDLIYLGKIDSVNLEKILKYL